MSYSDDDKDLPPVSQQEYFTRADHGKKEALKRAIREQEGKDISTQEAELKTNISLKQLKENVAGQSDEEKKRLEKEQERQEQSSGFGTKTHKQLEKEAVQTAQEAETPEKMIEKTKRKEDMQDRTEEEYQQQMG